MQIQLSSELARREAEHYVNMRAETPRATAYLLLIDRASRQLPCEGRNVGSLLRRPGQATLPDPRVDVVSHLALLEGIFPSFEPQ